MAPIQLNRSYSIHKWAIHKGKIQEKVSPRQQALLHTITSSNFQSLELNTRQSNKKKKARKEVKENLKWCHSHLQTSPSSGHWLAITLFFTLKLQERDELKGFKVISSNHGTIYCSSVLLFASASTLKNDALAMGMAPRMKVTTTTSQFSKPKSFYKNP